MPEMTRLVLLIIFMVITPLLHRGKEVVLDDAHRAGVNTIGMMTDPPFTRPRP